MKYIYKHEFRYALEVSFSILNGISAGNGLHFFTDLLQSDSTNIKMHTTGVVTVQDSQSGKSFSLILNLAKNAQKSPIKCLKEQNIHRKQSVYAYLIVNI